MQNNPNLEIQKKDYVIIIFSGVSNPMDELNDNVDVQVNFDDGRHYSATFFTIKNIQTLFDKNKETGECASGLYFSCSDMVIVEKLNREIIEHVVSSLLETNDLESVFRRIRD